MQVKANWWKTFQISGVSVSNDHGFFRSLGGSPELGISTVRLLLHSVPWQHCTMTPDSGGELPHCTASSSVPTMHPFCRRAVPFRMETEEKHCWPKQRPLLPHVCHSHTHSKSFTVALSTQDTHIYTHGWVNHSSSLLLSAVLRCREPAMSNTTSEDTKVCYAKQQWNTRRKVERRTQSLGFITQSLAHHFHCGLVNTL